MYPQYNNACGLEENEVRVIAKAYLTSHTEAELDKELEIMKQWFNGHRFCPPEMAADAPSLYNPQLVFTHLRTLSRSSRHVHPDEELNATHTASVLNAIKEGGEVNTDHLLRLLSGELRANVLHVFGVPEVRCIGRKADITWTLLYHFGVITRGFNRTLVIPNLTMRQLVCVFLTFTFRLPSNQF
jgi:hypothetical protein